ncbi:hypothetical protein TRIP_E190120 [uncultured Spirochaetota bacterium]|jgi:hypothetical protein|uniref:Transcriptional regulator n=1 Tax=uncultured Spirochaetota bacterium TaxID=460511 RepID=A0A652ZTW4_9SPIR|nr:hypothetical protein TRIP_E190120 [uncultured Spirochaetota bacterium]
MKFRDLLRLFGHRVWFDFEMLRLASGEAAESVHTEVYRWRRTGRLIELRRGLFVLAEPWRKQIIQGAELADPIYSPSYLSGRWALRYWKLLPPMPGLEYSSVSARPARTFTNSFGTYSYATLPRDLLFGTTIFPGAEIFDGATCSSGVEAFADPAKALQAGTDKRFLQDSIRRASLPRIALAEKALLDLCFIEGGEWDTARLAGLGLASPFKDLEPATPIPGPGILTARPGIDPEKLGAMAERSGRPRLIRAAKAFSKLAAGRGSRGAQDAEAPRLSWRREEP